MLKKLHTILIFGQTQDGAMGLLSKPNFMKSSVERYRDYMEELMGSKAEIFRDKSVDKKLPNVFTLVFRDTPSAGTITAFTFGVCYSSLTHEKDVKTELMLHIKSDNINWAHALGFIANHLREQCPFQVGQIVRFGQQVTADSPISNFVVNEPAEHFQQVISLSKKLQIQLVRLEPSNKV